MIGVDGREVAKHSGRLDFTLRVLATCFDPTTKILLFVTLEKELNAYVTQGYPDSEIDFIF